MLLGLSTECSHIPVLRVYAKHALSLMKGVKKETYYDKRTVYKSLAVEKHEPTDETAYFFLVRYGVAHSDMEEDLAASLTGNLTDCVSYRYMHLFTAIDL
jgi:hypothetical protein